MKSVLSTFVLFKHPKSHLISRNTPPLNQSFPANVITRPDLQPPLPQIVLVIKSQLFDTGPGDIGKLDLGFFDVPDAWLPSAMFCTPERAACTI